MKKNILKVAFVAAFALVAGYGVYTAKTQTDLSDLALDNVSALASGESAGAKCYGPKSSSECQCTNSTPCRDNSGCN
ncbi:NVEALA domain-containing protein [Bacteroides sp.]